MRKHFRWINCKVITRSWEGG